MRVQKEHDKKKLIELEERIPYFVIRYIEQTSLNKSISTVLSHVIYLLDFFSFLLSEGIVKRESIKDITPSDLEELYWQDFDAYRAHLKNRQNETQHGRKLYKTKNKNVTIRNKMGAIKDLYRFLSRNRERGQEGTYIRKNILAEYEVKTKEKSQDEIASEIEHKILNEDEIEEFIYFILNGYGDLNLHHHGLRLWQENCVRDAAMVTLILHSGLRVGEVVSLQLKDLNLDECYVKVERKGIGEDNKKVVYFSEYAKELLEDYLEIRESLYKTDSFPENPLFVTKGNKNTNGRAKILTKNAIQKNIMRYGDAFGKQELTVHCLRHTFATQLLKETGNIRIVQEALGHADVKTTQKYTHVLSSEKKEAVQNAFKKR